jgi:hypothetical protein
MIGAREPHHIRDGAGRPWTVLDCQLGGHSGVFTITQVRVGTAIRWACDACIAEHGATPVTRIPAR